MLVLVAMLCCALVPAVSAAQFDAEFTAPADGAAIHSGTVITAQITNLDAGDTFKYQITSSNLDTTGNTVTLPDVVLPFGFKSGSSKTALKFTNGVSGATSLTIKRHSDSTEVNQNRDPYSGNPDITIESNIKADTYDFTLTGTKTGGNVGIDFSVSGTVDAPQHSTNDLSFTIKEVKTGTITITISDKDSVVKQKSFTITQPPTPPNPSGGSEGYGGAPEGPAGPVGPAAPQQQAPAQLAPVQGTTATTATIAHNEQGQVLANYEIETDPDAGYSSSVSINVGTTAVMGPGTPNPGQPVGEISVTPLDPATVTVDTATSGTFSFSGLAIECGPEGAQFSGSPVTVSFTMTAAQWADALAAVNGNIAAMTIQTFDPATNAWVEVPTVVDPVTHTVSAQVTHFSTYAVFYKSQAAAGIKTIGELAQVTPYQPRVTTAAPAVTPAPTQMAPVATPTQQGGIFDGIVNWFNSLFGKK